MKLKSKLTWLIITGVVFVAQMGGCIFVDRDHHRDHDPVEHHDHEHADIDVNVH